MEDNEKELDLTTPEADVEEPQVEEEVKLEDNDNWQFDAEAPTISDDFFESSENIIVENADAKTLAAEAVADTENNSEEQEDGKDLIVINKESFKFVPVAVITAIVIAVVAFFGVRYYTVPNGKEGALMNPASVAATIDGTKISIGEFNYYYSSIVSYYEQYAAYGYFDLDTSKDYDAQFTTNDAGEQVTWADFFKEEAFEEIKNTTVYYKEGIKNGVTLTDAQKAAIEDNIEKMKASASSAKLDLDTYISNTFGDYCTEQTVRLMLEQYYVTANYKGKFNAEAKVNDDEINEYFEANKYDYYQINFSYIALPYDAGTEEKKADSQKTVDEYMKKITDRASIVALVPTVYAEYIEQDIKTAMEADNKLTEAEARRAAIANYEQNVDGLMYGSQSPFGEELNKWLFSDDTKIGEKNYYIDETSGYAYVLLKTEKATRLEDETYTVRHILITPEADKKDEEENKTPSYTDEQWAEAEKTANAIYDEFNSGDKSEYSFALLAEANSADTASLSTGSSSLFGGLCEAVPLGEMVEPFEKWSTDKSRKYGDTGIVKSDYGYHIMFFINDEPSYKAQIISAIREDKYAQAMTNADLKLHNRVIDNAIKNYNAKKAEAAVASPEE